MKCPVYVFVLCVNSLEGKIEKGGRGREDRKEEERGRELVEFRGFG